MALEAVVVHPSTTVAALETTVAASETPAVTASATAAVTASATATVTAAACRQDRRAERQQNPQRGSRPEPDSFRNGKVSHVVPLFSPKQSDGERARRIHPARRCGPW
jgi:hypothetical protein